MGQEDYPGAGNGNPFQYFCLGNPMDRGTWWARVHGVTNTWTRLSTHTHTHTKGHSMSLENLYLIEVQLIYTVVLVFAVKWLSYTLCDPIDCSSPYIYMSFPGGASGKESVCQCRRHKSLRFDPWVGKIPWSKKWQSPWSEEPGRLQSMGSQRVRHYTHTQSTHTRLKQLSSSSMCSCGSDLR